MEKFIEKWQSLLRLEKPAYKPLINSSGTGTKVFFSVQVSGHNFLEFSEKLLFGSHERSSQKTSDSAPKMKMGTKNIWAQGPLKPVRWAVWAQSSNSQMTTAEKSEKKREKRRSRKMKNAKK